MTNPTISPTPRADSARQGIDPILLSVKNTARALGISRTTLYVQLDRGAMPRSIVIGGLRFFPVVEINAWVARQLEKGHRRL